MNPLNENKFDQVSAQIDGIVLADRSYRPDGTLTNAARETLRALSEQLKQAEGHRSGSVVEYRPTIPAKIHRKGDPRRWTRTSQNPQH